MQTRTLLHGLAAVLTIMPAALQAQNPVPTTQPSVLTIVREEIKFGHNADHERTEAGWPAAYAKVKSPYSYIAISSLTGPNEVWFLSPYADWKQYGESVKADAGPALAAELARVARADAEHVSQGRSMHLVGRPDLSAGAFPSVAKTRYYQVTFFRVRSGHEQGFEQAAKAYQTAYNKAAPQASYRVYQVAAGMPGPVYLVFSSAETLEQWDKAQALDAALMGAFTPEQLGALDKFAKEGLINVETQRFAVNGRMSYVDDATAAQDPAFWRPKAATAAK
jgi:hypothetical protein